MLTLKTILIQQKYQVMQGSNKIFQSSFFAYVLIKKINRWLFKNIQQEQPD